jgi:integrase
MTKESVRQPDGPKQVPWNKGKLTGAKPPLRPKHVWAIRTKLQVEGRLRDLAFNLAIDSKLRGCDIVAVKLEDVAPNGYALDRATVRQKKTGRPVKFELTEATRQAIDDYLRQATKKPGEFLFSGRRGPARTITTRQYWRLVSRWIASIGIDATLFGTHSLCRTKAPLIYRRTEMRKATRSAPALLVSASLNSLAYPCLRSLIILLGIAVPTYHRMYPDYSRAPRSFLRSLLSRLRQTCRSRIR